MLCVVVVLLVPPPVSVPKLRTEVFLGIMSGQSACVISFAAVLEDAMKAVFVAESGRSSATKPAVS